MIGRQDDEAAPFIAGKGRKPRMVVCPNALTHRLKSYAYDNGIDADTRLFSINRKRTWRIHGRPRRQRPTRGSTRASAASPRPQVAGNDHALPVDVDGRRRREDSKVWVVEFRL